jgi:hypothetical protein
MKYCVVFLCAFSQPHVLSGEIIYCVHMIVILFACLVVCLVGCLLAWSFVCFVHSFCVFVCFGVRQCLSSWRFLHSCLHWCASVIVFVVLTVRFVGRIESLFISWLLCLCLCSCLRGCLFVCCGFVCFVLERLHARVFAMSSCLCLCFVTVLAVGTLVSVGVRVFVRSRWAGICIVTRDWIGLRISARPSMPETRCAACTLLVCCLLWQVVRIRRNRR